MRKLASMTSIYLVGKRFVRDVWGRHIDQTPTNGNLAKWRYRSKKRRTNRSDNGSAEEIEISKRHVVFMIRLCVLIRSNKEGSYQSDFSLVRLASSGSGASDCDRPVHSMAADALPLPLLMAQNPGGDADPFPMPHSPESSIHLCQ